MSGDIVKVTPSSKVVGDMALMMVAQGLTRSDVEDPQREIAFPESVVDMLRGNPGQPPGGWPEGLQRRVLKGEVPITCRPGALLPRVDMASAAGELAERLPAIEGEDASSPEEEEDICAWQMYPKVCLDYRRRHARFGPVCSLQTAVFFYGMRPGEEIQVEIDPGKTLEIRLQAVSEPSGDGDVTLFFELNGQPRVIRIADRTRIPERPRRPQAETGNPAHIGAPMPGLITSVAVRKGQRVKPGDLLFTMEAMKMESSLHAEREGLVLALHVSPGASAEARELLIELE